MKKNISFALFLICVCIMMQFIAIEVFGDVNAQGGFTNSARDIVLPNNVNLDAFIKNDGRILVDEEIEFGKDVDGIPKNSYCNIDTYYVSYGIGSVSDINHDILEETFRMVWPSVHIPVFCESEGQTRVVGEVRLTPTIVDFDNNTWGYKGNIIYHSLDQEPYKSGMECTIWAVAPSDEELARVCAENGLGNYSCAKLLHYNDAMFSTLSEFLIIQTDIGEYVYDFTDTAAQISGRPLTSDKIRFYALNEYKELREVLESKLAEQSGIGGSGTPIRVQSTSGKVFSWVIGVSSVFAFISLVVLLFLKRRSKKSSN